MSHKVKKIILVLAIIAFASCKTEQVYLIVFPQREVKTVIFKKNRCEIPYNRFTREFQIADSAFEKASKEAMQSASEKTKYLLPKWYKNRYIN